MFVVIIIHTSFNRNALTCTYFNFGCILLRTNNFTMSIFVQLFLFLEFYSNILIDQSGYFVYNSNRPTGRLLHSGFWLTY